MIEINNLTSFAVDKKLLTGVAKKVLKGENRERESISVALVSKEEIKKLNKQFRKKDTPTDVLSFNLKSNPKDVLGEVVICPEAVKENAKKFNFTFKEELVKMLVHGILHIAGYEHEQSAKEAKKMEAKELYYLSRILR